MRRRASLVVLCLLLAAGTGWSAPAAPGKRGRIAPPAHSISRQNLAAVHARLQRGEGLAAAKPHAADSLALVVLRIEFPDLRFGESPPADEQHDRFYYENQFRYVQQYFTAASCGRLQLRTMVPDLVAVAPQAAGVYGDVAAYDSLMLELAAAAVQAADPAVDFAAFGGVLLVHAGPGQESDIAGDSPNQIWSGFIDEITFREQLSTPDSTIRGLATSDGVEIRSITILPEWEVQDLQVSGGTRLGSLGVYVHEVGQSVGMIPLFDASPNFPDSQGLGNFDVMAYGLWVANGFIPPLPSTFNRLLQGWLQPIEVHAPGTVLLRDQERGPADSVVARVWISPREYTLVSYALEDPDGPHIEICSGDSVGPQRFFHFEDLDQDCFDFDFQDLDGDSVLSEGDLIDSYAGAEWDFFTTQPLGSPTGAGEGYGLLMLHVDEQVLAEVLARGSTNVEGDPRRKAVDVEEADGIEDLDRIADNPNAFGSAADYWVRGQRFGPESIPDTRSATGAPTGWSVELVALPDSAEWTPGPRARVQIGRGPAGSGAAALQARASCDFEGEQGADLVALPLGDGRAALLVPADSGRVFLADADLGEAPVADADSAALAPWMVVPPAWRGRWIGPPAVGDLDGDAVFDALLCAQVDSAGAPRTRLFAWGADGIETRDLDGLPGTNSGLFATVAGAPAPPCVVDQNGDGKSEVVLATQIEDSVRVVRVVHDSGPNWGMQTLATVGGNWAGGPIAVRAMCDSFEPCPHPIGIGWAVADSVRGALVVYFERVGGITPVVTTLAPGPVRLAAGNLDGVEDDEVLVGSAGGDIDLVTVTRSASGGEDRSSARRLASLGASDLSPFALADLDGNGTLEFAVATESAICLFASSGAVLPGWPYPFRREPALEREPAPGRGAGSPLLADLDGDGEIEVAIHLPGGAFLVWNPRGEREPDLEAALPARGLVTPLLADLDGAPGPELAALGRFASAVRYRAPAESLVVAPRTQLAVWRVPRAGEILWGELGGGPGHAFHGTTAAPIQPAANDPALPSFHVFPNPAGREVRLRVTLTAAAEARGRIFNLEGELVMEERQAASAGSIAELVFDLGSCAPGIYLAQLELSTGGRQTRPFVVRR